MDSWVLCNQMADYFDTEVSAGAELLAHLEACGPDAHIGGDVTAALLGAVKP